MQSENEVQSVNDVQSADQVFGELFRRRYLSAPFASLTKSETDYVLFSCLVDSGFIDARGPVFATAERLQVTPAKARAMLYQYHLRTLSGDLAAQTAALSRAIVVVGFTESDDSEKETLTLGIENGYLRDVLVARLKASGVFTDSRMNRELVEVKLYRFVQAFRELFPESVYDDTIDKLEAESRRKKSRSRFDDLLRSVLAEVGNTTVRSGTTQVLASLSLTSVLQKVFPPAGG